jgi:release factor glutamine methyltransferase
MLMLMKAEQQQPDCVGKVLRDVTRSSPVSDLDAQLLLAHILDVDRSWLFAHDDASLTNAQRKAFASLAERRASGEPLAYITGKSEFWKSVLTVNSSVLDPRPETELLVELVLSLLRRDVATVLDLGTGSGAIAIAVKGERPAWQVIATDLHPETVQTARVNSNSIGVSVVRGNWLDSVEDASLDAIVSNPPYIEENDPHLDALGHEPRHALVSGPDGLDAIRTIIRDAPRCLVDGGFLILEHGHDQQERAMELMLDAGFSKVTGRADMNSVPRAVYGQWL